MRNLDAQAIEALVTNHEASGLDVICAPNDPGDADRIPVSVVTELHQGRARQNYDYVIVDTPPSFTEHVLAACDLSDALVLIATLDIPAVKNLRVAIDTLDMLGSPKDARVIVLNRADAKVGLRPDDVVAAIKAPDRRQHPELAHRAVVGEPRRADRARRPARPGERRAARARRCPHPSAVRGDVECSRRPRRKSLFRGRR